MSGLFAQLNVTITANSARRFGTGTFSAPDGVGLQIGGSIGSSSGSWGVSRQVGGSGSITVTGFTSTTSTGGFTFSAVPAAPTTGNHTVSGSFNVTFQFPVTN